MRVLALTGGIGTGKSLVAGLIRKAGVPVVDADRISREIMEPGTGCHEEVVARFGDGIVGPDGRIDRKRLGAIVFGDPGKRALLESITHPRIREGIESAISSLEAEGHPAAVVEAALILENRREGRFDAVVCVYCDRDTQIRRIVARDGIPAAEAEARIAAQMDPLEKARRSDHVIDNSGSPEETEKQVEALLARLDLAP